MKKLLLFLTIILFSVNTNAQEQNLKEWWQDLPKAWKEVFKEHIGIKHSPNEKELQKIVSLDTLNISKNKNIKNLNPVRKLHKLKELNFYYY